MTQIGIPSKNFGYSERAGSGATAADRSLMRVLLADDHDLVRDTLALFMTSENLAEVVTACTLDEAVEAADATGSFDLVLLDYNMPGMNGLQGLARMIDANDGRPVAILSGTADATVAAEAINAGAAGFVPKTLGAKSMLSAVKFMAAGEVFVPFGFMQDGAPKTVGNLTERETQVLGGLVEGKSNKEIARDLDLQEVTIKLHVRTLCKKLDARNRTHAAMIARDRQLI